MIYLDMDGVIADWDRSAEELLGQPIDSVSKSQLWKRIDAEGFKFWADLKPFPYAEKFVNELRRIDEVVICSSPSLDVKSVSGKLRWLQKFFGSRNFRNYVFTPQKHLLGKDGNILIDDREKHVEGFNQNGGFGILFPRPYNRNKKYADDPVNYVIDQLRLMYPSNRFADDYDEEDWYDEG